MTSLKKKLTLLLITLFAAICLGAGMFLLPSASPSAAVAEVTLVSRDNFEINNGVFTGLTQSGMLATDGKKFKIELPADVTEIGTGEDPQSPTQNALFGRNVSNLVEVTFKLPTSITKIGKLAFNGCSSLETIDLSAATNLATIEQGAFKGCSRLEYMTLPVLVSSFSDELFSGCTSLREVTTGNNAITTIGAKAFENCYALTSVTIPENLETVGASAFYGCRSLVNIVLPDTAVNIGASAFARCAGLKTIRISDNITEIADGTFSNCTSLNRIYTDKEDTTSIFALPSGITHIGREAFNACISLTEIIVPSTVTTINDRAFYGCGLVSDIYYYAEQASLSTGAVNTFGVEDAFTDVTLHIGNADNVVKQLPPNLFFGHRGLVKIEFDNVKLPAGVAAWGAAAFSDCSSLKKIIFNSNCVIPVINTNAFANCTNLTDIEGLESADVGLGTIESQAFFNCSSLRTFTIGGNVAEIKTNAFLNCRKLVEVKNLSTKTNLVNLKKGDIDCGLVAYYALRVYKEGGSKIDENNTNHPDYVFYADLEPGGAGVWLMDYVGTATDIDLPNGYNGVGSYNILHDAFLGKKTLNEVIIPNIAQIQKIGDSAFADCTSLTHIQFPYTLLEVGDNMMQGCTALTSVDFGVHPSTPNVGVGTIKHNMFKGCVSLETITLPRNITAIESNAFENCEKLTSITFGAGLTGVNRVELLKTIAGEAFKGCKELALVELPSSVTNIGQSAFADCPKLRFVYLSANATYGSNVFDSTNTDLILISKSKEAYVNDKNNSLSPYAQNLTYIVDVKLVYEGGPSTSGEYGIQKLFKRNAGYENNSSTGRGIWNMSGSMPLPKTYNGTSFVEFVWFKTNEYNLADMVDIDAFTALLADDALLEDNANVITLYGNYILKPSLSANDHPITYDENKTYTLEQIFTEILAETSDSSAGFTPIDSSKFNEYKNKFRFNIVTHRFVNDEKNTGFLWDPNGTISEAGTYELEIKLNSNYGTWSTPYTITFKINPKLQDISKVIEWRTAGGGSLGPDNPFAGDVVPTEAQIIASPQTQKLYFYNGGTIPYKNLPVNGETYTTKYVLESCTAYDEGTLIEVLLAWVNAKAYGTVVEGSYTGNKGANEGTYTATAVIKPNNNYLLTFTSDALTRALGLDFSRAADGAVTVSKTWYIYIDGNNRLVVDGGGDYKFGVRDDKGNLIDWVYKSVISTQVPKPPQVLYGNTAALLSYSLEYNGELVTESGTNKGFIRIETDNAWSHYINSAMPVGDYVLTFHIDPYKDGNNTYGSDDYEFKFSVKPAIVGNSDRNQIINTLKDAKKEYTGNVIFINTSGLNLFTKKKEIQVNNGAGIGYWASHSEYYTAFEAYYYVVEAGKDYPDKGYYTEQKYIEDKEDGVSTRSFPVNIGTYTIYYKISAPNYCFEFPVNSKNYVTELTGSYTLNITHTLKKFTVDERNYTGVSVLSDVEAILRRGNSEIFDDYSFLDVYTLTETSKGTTPDNFFTSYGKPEGDPYIDVGWHYVFLTIKDIYKDYILWDNSISSGDFGYGFVKGVNRRFLVVKFEITSSSDMETTDGKLSIASWEYGMFTREANSPHWKLLFNTDESTYQFQLIALDGGNTYYFNNDPQAALDGLSFRYAPAGRYTLKAISPENPVKGWGRFEREIEIEVREATLVFKEVPYIDSWNYGNLPKNIGLPNLAEALDGFGNLVSEKVKIYYCLKADYDRVDGVPALYDSLDKMKNSEGQVPAGEYYVIYRLNKEDLTEGQERDNFAQWEYKVRFKVLSATNSWKSLYMPDFDYVDYDTAIALMEVVPNFGDASKVFIQFRRKGTDSAFQSLDRLLNIEGKLDIGTYELRAILAATENFARMESVTSFTVSRAANKWIDVPSIRGWAEGNYSAEKNGIIAKAALGNVELTITDENGKEYSTHDLDSLGIGTYKLTAKVAGTNNYDELISEIYFDVIEDSVGMTGLIASTVVFSVVALGLAGAAIALLVLRNKKAEREFRKAVRNELRRK